MPAWIRIPNKEEFLVTSPGEDKVVAKIGPVGNLFLRGAFHDAMDDVNDTCDTESPNPSEASEEYYLDHPPTPAMKISGADGKTVAYIDADGEVRLKGHVFVQWTHWNYWN